MTFQQWAEANPYAFAKEYLMVVGTGDGDWFELPQQDRDHLIDVIVADEFSRALRLYHHFALSARDVSPPYWEEQRARHKALGIPDPINSFHRS